MNCCWSKTHTLASLCTKLSQPWLKSSWKMVAGFSFKFFVPCSWNGGGNLTSRRSEPLPVTVTTRIWVGNVCQPLFGTVAGRGPHPMYAYLHMCMIHLIVKSFRQRHWHWSCSRQVVLEKNLSWNVTNRWFWLFVHRHWLCKIRSKQFARIRIEGESFKIGISSWDVSPKIPFGLSTRIHGTICTFPYIWMMMMMMMMMMMVNHGKRW